jgi:hypothetical protein
MLQLVLAPLHHCWLVGHHDCCATHSENGIGHQIVLDFARVEAVGCDLRRHKQSNAVGVCLTAQQADSNQQINLATSMRSVTAVAFTCLRSCFTTISQLAHRIALEYMKVAQHCRNDKS